MQCGWDGGIGTIDPDPLFLDADGFDNVVGTSDDDLRLSADSPCIDAGNNTALPPDTLDLDGGGDTAELIPLDLDLSPRLFGSLVDLGTYKAAIFDQLVKPDPELALPVSPLI